MASDQSLVDFIVDQFDPARGVTSKKMFGEYGLFSEGKMFAYVCDNRLLFKPTEGGRAFIGDVVQGEPYPGAKPAFLIEDRVEDGPWLSRLAEITTAELPVPKKRKRKGR
jgi:TfoX/Sxy family transcriptional regulator of competence genes